LVTECGFQFRWLSDETPWEDLYNKLFHINAARACSF
jgi:hypothetical protein